MLTPVEILKQFFTEGKLMQLATVADGQPWVCNVYFVTDENNNIYWTSAKKRRHSQEILANPMAAATIVYDEKKKQAVQLIGKAYEVSLDEVEKVDKLYSDKFGYKDRLTEIRENKPDGRAYWVLKPEVIELFDELNFPDEPKQKVNI